MGRRNSCLKPVLYSIWYVTLQSFFWWVFGCKDVCQQTSIQFLGSKIIPHSRIVPTTTRSTVRSEVYTPLKQSPFPQMRLYLIDTWTWTRSCVMHWSCNIYYKIKQQVLVKLREIYGHMDYQMLIHIIYNMFWSLMCNIVAKYSDVQYEYNEKGLLLIYIVYKPF